MSSFPHLEEKPAQQTCGSVLSQNRSVKIMHLAFLFSAGFAGGGIFDGPWGRVASANITPDPSGISYYDQAMFRQVIHTGFVGARKLNQIMSWHAFRGMTDEDIVAVFAYLKTLKPVRHRVDNTEPPAFCKICRQTHGGANQN